MRQCCEAISGYAALVLLFLSNIVFAQNHMGNTTTLPTSTILCNSCNINQLATGGTLTTTSTVIFDGTCTVNQNFNFVSCPNLVFGANAAITVASGAKLTIDNSTLKAACPFMWKGITTLAANAAVVVHASAISDMIDGIHTPQGAMVSATSSTFTNNYISLWYEHTPDNYAADIYANTFQGVGSLLNPAQGPKARYGVYSSNAQYLKVGNYSNGNTFDNLRTGIYIALDNAPSGVPHRYFSLNNQFQNITGAQYGSFPDGGVNSIYEDPDGTAIFGANSSPTPSYCYVTCDYTLGNTNKIMDCTKGITLTAMSAEVYHTHITNSIWAINFSKTENYTYMLQSNTLVNAYYGMQFVGNPAYGYVYDNVISSSTLSSMAYNYVVIAYPVGIDVSFYAGGSNTFTIASNTIAINSFSGVGINLRNTGAGLSLLKNIITLTTNTVGPPVSGGGLFSNPPLKGIALSNCTGSSLQGNHIDGTSAVVNTSRTNVAGIYISKSPKLLLECNHISSTRYGFLTLSDCGTANTNVRGNTFQNHINGMLFRHLGSEGTLKDIGRRDYDAGNSFSGNYAINSGSFMKVFRMSVCSTPSYDNIYTSNGTLTANESGGNNSACRYFIQNNTQPYTSFSCPPGLLRLSPDEVNMISDIGFAEQVARDSVQYAEYQQGSSRISAQRLYYELWLDAQARGESGVLDSFYLAMQNEPYADMREADELLKGGSDTLYAQDSLLYVQWLRHARDANDAIMGTDIQVQNEAAINGIYLRYLAGGMEALEAEDTSFIASLALSCPFLNGTAVYKARTLYSLYLPALSYDDLDICNNTGIYKGGHGLFDQENTLLAMQTQPGSAEKRVEVFPNPTTGRLTVHYSLNEGEQGAIEITDIYGRSILKAALHSMLSSQQLDMGTQPAGIYFYRYFINGVQRVTGKISLEK